MSNFKAFDSVKFVPARDAQGRVAVGTVVDVRAGTRRRMTSPTKRFECKAVQLAARWFVLARGHLPGPVLLAVVEAAPQRSLLRVQRSVAKLGPPDAGHPRQAQRTLFG